MPSIVIADHHSQFDWRDINDALAREAIKQVWEVPNCGQSDAVVVVGVSSAKEAQEVWDAEMEADEVNQ